MTNDCYSNKVYVKFLNDDYVKRFTLLYYKRLVNPKEETKSRDKKFTVFVLNHDILNFTNRLEFKYNEKILFNYITEKFKK